VVTVLADSLRIGFRSGMRPAAAQNGDHR
jgi:hypothetical protein